MDTLIHADIFFFIASTATVIFGVLFSCILVFIILILRDLKQLSALMLRGGEKISADIDKLRSAAKEGVQMKSILDFFLALLVHRNKKRAAKQAESEVN